MVVHSQSAVPQCPSVLGSQSHLHCHHKVSCLVPFSYGCYYYYYWVQVF